MQAFHDCAQDLTAHDHAVDVVAVLADDALLDALVRGCELPDAAADDPLVPFLVAWRGDVAGTT